MPLPIGLATAESRTEQKDSQIQDDEKFAKKKMEDDFDVGCKCDYHRDKSQNDSPTLGLHSASNRPDTLKNDGNDKNLIQESALSLAIESIKVPSNSGNLKNPFFLQKPKKASSIFRNQYRAWWW